MRMFKYPFKIGGQRFRLFVNSKISTQLSQLVYDVASKDYEEGYRLRIGIDSPIDEIINTYVHEFGHLLVDTSRSKEETEGVLALYQLGRLIGQWSPVVFQEEILAWITGLKFFLKAGLRFPESFPAWVKATLVSYVVTLHPRHQEKAMDTTTKFISLLMDMMSVQKSMEGGDRHGQCPALR